jgi:hypothetical protein
MSERSRCNTAQPMTTFSRLSAPVLTPGGSDRSGAAMSTCAFRHVPGPVRRQRVARQLVYQDWRTEWFRPWPSVCSKSFTPAPQHPGFHTDRKT